MAVPVRARETSSSLSHYKWRGGPPFSSQALTDRGTLRYKFMGGSQSSVSFCGLFNKKKKSWSESEYEGDERAQRKVWPSDEFEEVNAGRGRWVGEVDVDSKASAFIAKFHQTRIMLMDQLEASQTV